MPTFLKEDRASRSLAKTGLSWEFFSLFFLRLFSTSFLNRFFFAFGRVLGGKMAPEIDFCSVFFNVFLGPSFCSFLCLIFVVF